MRARLKIDPRTQHVFEGVIAFHFGDKPDLCPDAVADLMSLEFEVVGVGPNGEQALCAIDPESSVKP